jgi:two-component system, chemotaxis family, chemotaxis protein CheY
VKALVVDDSRAMRRIIAKLLVELGFEVHEAASGLEALQLADKLEGLTLVLLDWNMPELDGRQVLERLRADERFADLAVMMVTTESEMEQVEVALNAGASEYLMKPFDRQALLEKLLLLGFDPESRAA